jgi:NAD(P)H-binding
VCGVVVNQIVLSRKDGFIYLTAVQCREVVKDLLKKGVKVKALVRDTRKAGRVLPVAAEIFEEDVYQYADVVKAVEGVDAIICASSATSPTDPLGPFNIDYTVCFPSLFSVLSGRQPVLRQACKILFLMHVCCTDRFTSVRF